MKKSLLTLGCILLAGSASLFGRGILLKSAKATVKFTRQVPAPAIERCSIADHEAHLESINPNRAAERQSFEQQVNTWIAANANNPTVQGGTITIPVVVHVVWNTAAENISDNQVLSQIQVLNEDFGRTNPDASNTPSYWTSIAANTDIQFCMATVDPQGNPTTGIERRQTTVTTFSTNDNVKFFAQGGLNAWSVTSYINMWVCDLTAGLLGYGEFPTGTASNTWGLVMDYQCFGSNYTSYGSGFTFTPGFDRGRTSTHELGHCFDLYHIWGDDGTSCSGSDLVSDTPNQADEHYGCPSGSQVSCSNGPNGDMYQNYMDYSDDICMNLFTLGQKTRMLAVLNSTPYNALQTSTACQSASNGIDAGISAIISPATTICNTTFTPQVTIRNYGTTTLTSAVINYRIDAGPIQTYNWSGSLTTNQTANVTLSSMTTTAGTHTFTSYTTNPNSSTDANAGNDQSQRTFTVSATGANLPYSQGFESTTFVPAGWTLNNPDASITWARTTTASSSGSASAKMDNWNYQGGNGQIDEMQMQSFNLSSVSNPVMTFQVAYTYWTVPYQFSDTLKILISTDCGVTWTTLYNKYGATLQTAPPVSSSTVGFAPTGPSQWRLETVNLAPYQASTNAMIKFRNITDYEDNLFIDDINIMNSTDVPGGLLHSNINLFPNPTDGLVNLDIEMYNRDNVKITVINSIGQVVSSVGEENTYGGRYVLDLTAEPNGIYFIEVQAGTEVVTRRIVISH